MFSKIIFNIQEQMKEQLELLQNNTHPWFKFNLSMFDEIGPTENTNANSSELQKMSKRDHNFQTIGIPDHGSHTLQVMEDPKNKKQFIKKIASSQKEAEKEVFLSHYLHTINPYNPKCYFSKQDRTGRTVLSRKPENAVDVEMFLRNGGIDRMKEKKITGLEQTLLNDLVLGKQSDIKLANMIVIEKDNELIFANIDHGRANYPKWSFVQSGKNEYPIDVNQLVERIYDQYSPSEENRSGLAGDPRAKEFIELAKQKMQPQNLYAAYKNIVTANTALLYEHCLSFQQKGEHYNNRFDCNAYKAYIEKLKQGACQTMENLDKPHANKG